MTSCSRKAFGNNLSNSNLNFNTIESFDTNYVIDYVDNITNDNGSPRKYVEDKYDTIKQKIETDYDSIKDKISDDYQNVKKNIKNKYTNLKTNIKNDINQNNSQFDNSYPLSSTYFRDDTVVYQPNQSTFETIMSCIKLWTPLFLLVIMIIVIYMLTMCNNSKL